MSFPLSPPPSRSSSQTSFYKSQFTTSTHNPSYSTPVSPPASHHMHNALAKPRLPILSVPPVPPRGTSASPAPESGYGSSTVLRSFFSPCSSDEEEEEGEGEKQTPNSSFELNSATARSSTRKPIRGHFSRLWASQEAPSPPPEQKAPEPASEEEEEGGEMPVGRRVSVPGKLKLKVSRRSRTSTAVVSGEMEFGYKQFLPMSGDDDDEDEDEYNYYDYDTPLNDEKQTLPTQGWPIRGSSITTAKRNYLPTPPQQQQPDLQQHTTSRTPLYYHGTEIPPPHRPHSQRSQKQQLDSLESSEILAKHQAFTSSLLSTKSHALQARILLSNHLNSQPTTSSSNLITALATLHSSLANTESLYLETLTAAAPHTTTTAAAALQEARRRRDHLLVQTQKAYLRKSSVRRIHHLHAQLQDSEQALKQAEFKAAREKAEEMFWKEVEAVEERALRELEVARGLRRSFGGIGLTGAAGVVRDGEELVEEEEEEEDEREKRREKRECWSWSESERSHFSSDEDDDDDNEEEEEEEGQEKEGKEEVVRTDTLRSRNRTIPRSASISNNPFTPETHHHHQHNYNSLPIPFSMPPPLSLTTSTTTANLLPPFEQNQKTQKSPLGFRRGTFGFYESESESEDEDEPENQHHVHEEQTEETDGLALGGVTALGAEAEEVEGLTGGGRRGGVREEEVEEEEVFCTARVARVGVPVLVAMI